MASKVVFVQRSNVFFDSLALGNNRFIFFPLSQTHTHTHHFSGLPLAGPHGQQSLSCGTGSKVNTAGWLEKSKKIRQINVRGLKKLWISRWCSLLMKNSPGPMSTQKHGDRILANQRKTICFTDTLQEVIQPTQSGCTNNRSV